MTLYSVYYELYAGDIYLPVAFTCGLSQLDVKLYPISEIYKIGLGLTSAYLKYNCDGREFYASFPCYNNNLIIQADVGIEIFPAYQDYKQFAALNQFDVSKYSQLESSAIDYNIYKDYISTIMASKGVYHLQQQTQQQEEEIAQQQETPLQREEAQPQQQEAQPQQEELDEEAKTKQCRSLQAKLNFGKNLSEKDRYEIRLKMHELKPNRYPLPEPLDQPEESIQEAAQEVVQTRAQLEQSAQPDDLQLSLQLNTKMPIEMPTDTQDNINGMDNIDDVDEEFEDIVLALDADDDTESMQLEQQPVQQSVQQPVQQSVQQPVQQSVQQPIQQLDFEEDIESFSAGSMSLGDMNNAMDLGGVLDLGSMNSVEKIKDIDADEDTDMDADMDAFVVDSDISDINNTNDSDIIKEPEIIPQPINTDMNTFSNLFDKSPEIVDPNTVIPTSEVVKNILDTDKKVDIDSVLEITREAEQRRKSDTNEVYKVLEKIQNEVKRWGIIKDSFDDVLSVADSVDESVDKADKIISSVTDNFNRQTDNEKLLRSFEEKTNGYASLVDSIPESGMNPDLKLNSNKVIVLSTKSNLQESPNIDTPNDQLSGDKSKTSEIHEIISKANSHIENVQNSLNKAEKISKEIDDITTSDYIVNPQYVSMKVSDIQKRLKEIYSSMKYSEGNISISHNKDNESENDPFKSIENIANEVISDNTYSDIADNMDRQHDLTIPTPNNENIAEESLDDILSSIQDLTSSADEILKSDTKLIKDNPIGTKQAENKQEPIDKINNISSVSVIKEIKDIDDVDDIENIGEISNNASVNSNTNTSEPKVMSLESLLNMMNSDISQPNIEEDDTSMVNDVDIFQDLDLFSDDGDIHKDNYKDSDNVNLNQEDATMNMLHDMFKDSSDVKNNDLNIKGKSSRDELNNISDLDFDDEDTDIVGKFSLGGGPLGGNDPFKSHDSLDNIGGSDLGLGGSGLGLGGSGLGLGGSSRSDKLGGNFMQNLPEPTYGVDYSDFEDEEFDE